MIWRDIMTKCELCGRWVPWCCKHKVGCMWCTKDNDETNFIDDKV